MNEEELHVFDLLKSGGIAVKNVRIGNLVVHVSVNCGGVDREFVLSKLDIYERVGTPSSFDYRVSKSNLMAKVGFQIRAALRA